MVDNANQNGGSCMLGKRLKGMKNAELTVEIGLSLALTVVALFLVLGLFSQNLKSMVDASGMKKNLFNKTTIAKTTYDNHSVDYTASQVNVEVVADQGLDWYLTNAQATIDKYKDSTNLTEAQIEDLAKAATIISLDKLAPQDVGHGIVVRITKGITTINNTKILQYDRYTDVYETTHDPNGELKIIKDITRVKFS